jgi:hypothetical protein
MLAGRGVIVAPVVVSSTLSDYDCIGLTTSFRERVEADEFLCTARRCVAGREG